MAKKSCNETENVLQSILTILVLYCIVLYCILLYGRVSKGLETTKSKNLIG